MTVTTGDIAVALGRATPAQGSVEAQQWEMWISDALMLIEARLGDPTLLDPNKLDYVVREAVVAQVRRPDDATQVSISIDDGNTSRTYRTSRGRVVIQDEWWDLLSPASTSGGAFSILISQAPSSAHALICNLRMGGSWCSCGADIAGEPIYETP